MGECRGGVCEIACSTGWMDVDAYPFNGCEYACTPTATSESPGPACSDGSDNDCDARTDDADPDCTVCVPEFCNGADDDCDGLTDEDFDVDFDTMHCGSCDNACPPRLHALPACVLGTCDVACEAGWSDLDGVVATGCEASCVPTPGLGETACDGIDADCDGLTDEDWVPTTSCGTGWCQRPATCSAGTTTCRPRTPPTTMDATCDLVDDDCDTATDEDYVSVACGTTGCEHTICTGGAVSCVPGGAGTPETCNGADDDCDTSCDETFGCCLGASRACATTCSTAGTQTCGAGCAWGTCTPPLETCNGVDDDCDMACDDGYACCAGRTTSCTTTCGTTGTTTCSSSCSPGTCTPPAEVRCNRIDDDCDGTTDTWGTIGGRTQVTFATNIRAARSIVWTGSEYGITWEDWRTSVQPYFARISSVGTKLTGDILVSTLPGTGGLPFIAWNGSEYGLVFQGVCGPGATSDGICYNRISSTGTLLGTEARLSSNASLAGGADIAWLAAAANYGVVWHDNRSGSFEVYFGRPGGTEVVITSADAILSQRPFLAAAGSEFGIVWHDQRDGNWEIYFTRVSSTGTKLIGDVRLTNNSAESHRASIAWNGSEYGIAWADNRDGNFEIYFTRVSSSGTKIGADIRITNAAGDSWWPWIVWNGTEYGVFWRDRRDGNDEPYFCRISSAGVKDGSDVRINTDATLVDMRQIYAAWSGSEFGVVWAEGNGSEDEVYFARVGCL
jgi:hypothetical protein